MEKNKNNPEFLEKHIISIEKAFIQIYGNDNYIELDEKKLELLYNGVKLKNNKASGLYRIYDGQKNFIGIAKLENGYLKREIWL